MSFATQEFVRLAGRALHQYGMLSDGDRVLVGLSGGKDSLALLRFLAERRARIPIDYQVVAAHLDLGYEDPAQTDALKAYVDGLGLESHFEKTDYAPTAHSEVNRENPCFLCSRLRRRRLFELARDYRCAKVALGHHRDDLNETLLLNIFYSGEISTMLPVQEFFQGLVTIIRPLCAVPEDLVRKVTAAWGLPVVENPCPSSGRSKRNEVKEIIARLARSNDKIKGNIFRALRNVRTDYLLGMADNGRGRANGGRRSAERPQNKEAFDMAEEQRVRQRVKFRALVSLSGAGRDLRNLESRDVSLKGLFVCTDEKLSPGEPVDIQLHLSGSTSSLALSMKGRVARVEPDGLALDFTEIDIDSFYHLRNLVAYNTGDPNSVDAEVSTKPAF